MDFPILDAAVQQFINANSNADISKLALSKNPFPQIDWIDIINQIAAKAKAKDKLPTWFATKDMVYPAKVSVEQTSSETTALYKSQIVSGESLIDLTGGFGIDDYYFAKKMRHVDHCEINASLSAIVRHNFQQLKVENIDCHTGDSYDILRSLHKKFDWIYIDPSRRNDAIGKVFLLKDCLPNVPENLDFYFSRAPDILVKTSPILDISAGLAELKHVKRIHIVSVKNEVKELLWELEQGYFGPVQIKAIDFTKDKEETFAFEYDTAVAPTFGLPEKFLFEPNAAVMKSGGFDEISIQFKIAKLHRHSHLYTSKSQIDFPGRIFTIDKILDFSKASIKELSQIKKANITTRNFPDSVETIRKKLKIADGGNVFCFFTTDVNNHKIVLICSKIK